MVINWKQIFLPCSIIIIQPFLVIVLKHGMYRPNAFIFILAKLVHKISFKVLDAKEKGEETALEDLEIHACQF